MTQQTVLYVEDNEYNRKIVRQLLAGTSYRLIEAVDGEAGVEVARRELPDLILMDVPRELLARVREILPEAAP